MITSRRDEITFWSISKNNMSKTSKASRRNKDKPRWHVSSMIDEEGFVRGTPRPNFSKPDIFWELICDNLGERHEGEMSVGFLKNIIMLEPAEKMSAAKLLRESGGCRVSNCELIWYDTKIDNCIGKMLINNEI